MIDRRGMGVGQIFVFIIAALTFGLIMIFGYKAIGGFLQSGEDVAFVQFKTNLESSIQKIYTEYGSVRVEEFSLPAKYERICIVDMDYPVEKIAAEMEQLCSRHVKACDVWDDAKRAQQQEAGKSGYDSVDENVFLTPEAPVKIKTFRISLYDEARGENVGFLCADVESSKVSFVLEGKGDRTELSLKVSGG